MPVLPGPITPVDLQSITEAVCIKVLKVYDACSQKSCDTFNFPLTLTELPLAVAPGSTVENIEVVPGSETFRDVTVTPIAGGPTAAVSVTVCATIRFTLKDNIGVLHGPFTREVCFRKENVILFVPDPVKMQIEVESIFQTLGDERIEIISGVPNLVVSIGAFIIIKVVALVQLLIPAFGFCPVPPECEERLTPCQEFANTPFPPFFPPQPSTIP